MINHACQALVEAELVSPTMLAVLDGSFESRLKQMKMRTASTLEDLQESFDNFLRGAMQTIACLKRIKKANRIGLFYWYHGKETTDKHFNHLDCPNYFGQDKSFIDLMKKDPLLCAAGLEAGLGFELDNLATFLAGLMKDRAVGRYYMNASKHEGDQFKGFDNIYGPDLLNILSTIYEEQSIIDFNAINDNEFIAQEGQGQTPQIKQEHYSSEGSDYKRITMPERFSDLIKGAQNAKAQLHAAQEMFQETRQAENLEIVRDQAQAKAKSTKKVTANRAKTPRKAKGIVVENKPHEVAKKKARRFSGKKVLTLDTVKLLSKLKKHA